MHASPRLRRLRNDLLALEQLRDESSVFSFTAQGNPPHHYHLTFKGRSLWRDRGQVRPLEVHRVEIKLGASYPRTMPEIRWVTPIYHPNISEIGMVCLGGYGTNWVPSVQLDELCTMLWDMARYHNYDIRSPYNRDSALWAANQVAITFPTDSRPLRDLRAKKGRIVPPPGGADPRTMHQAGSHQQGSNGDGPAKPGGATRIRRFAQIYGMIFGTDEGREVLVESMTTRARELREATPHPSPRRSPSAPLPPSADPTPTRCDPPAGAEPPPPLPQASGEDRPDSPTDDTPIPGPASIPELVFHEVRQSPPRDRPEDANADEEILFIG